MKPAKKAAPKRKPATTALRVAPPTPESGEGRLSSSFDVEAAGDEVTFAALAAIEALGAVAAGIAVRTKVVDPGMGAAAALEYAVERGLRLTSKHGTVNVGLAHERLEELLAITRLLDGDRPLVAGISHDKEPDSPEELAVVVRVLRRMLRAATEDAIAEFRRTHPEAARAITPRGAS